jgi:CheY-like chemotaxis protein
VLTTRAPRTALVVDDSAGARRRMGTLLRLGGWRVHEAIGMDAALREAAALDPDLVVTDMTMRRGNGPALLRALRQMGCAARFLAVSSEITQDVRARAAAADAAACLAKPVDPRLLVDVLARLVAEPTAPAGPDAPQTVHIPAERLDLLDQVRVAMLPGPRPMGAPDAGRPALGQGYEQATATA